MVTTLHGTDITLIGNDPSYSQIVAFSIEQSDGVTAVSNSLRESTYAELQVTREIAVIPNFLDCAVHRRRPRPELRRHFTGGDEDAKIVIHVSNFRPVKRVEAVVDIFNRIQQKVPARLLLVGDGPDLTVAQRWARELGISHLVHAVGAQEEVVPLLSIADVFLLPSAQESFGLAALEAMACEVPVVASRRRRVARGDRARRERIPASARRRGGDGGERGGAAHRSRAAASGGPGRLPARARGVLRRARRADVRGLLPQAAVLIARLTSCPASAGPSDYSPGPAAAAVPAGTD